MPMKHQPAATRNQAAEIGQARKNGGTGSHAPGSAPAADLLATIAEIEMLRERVILLCRREDVMAFMLRYAPALLEAARQNGRLITLLQKAFESQSLPKWLYDDIAKELGS